MPTECGTKWRGLYSACVEQFYTSKSVPYTTPKRRTYSYGAGSEVSTINPLTPDDLKECREMRLLKIKIKSTNMREKLTNAPIISSVY
jgi:hypothetical protein